MKDFFVTLELQNVLLNIKVKASDLKRSPLRQLSFQGKTIKYQTFRLLILVAETVSAGFSVLWLIYRWPGNLPAIVKLLHWLKALRI